MYEVIGNLRGVTLPRHNAPVGGGPWRGGGAALTYCEQVPGDGGRGEAGEHVVGGAEVGEVGAGHGLTAALPPHQHLAALRPRRRRVAGVARRHLHHPAGTHTRQASAE